MDTVFIEGLEVETLIGAYEWERNIRQCLYLDLVMGWDIRPAAAGDALDEALDYAKVIASVEQFAAQADYILVETFAEDLASMLMREFGIPWLRVRVNKPGVHPCVRSLGVEIERGCR
ncbi:dihydroneopterin aldolase [Azomonas macrocytogenes]|uniref:7,8-dihydroneopterin aldolase n=1 Tax=Azomonas macrocytogenes TaxID=69962 RepID=A0A839SXL6_AZOMA|nr:dihydroneopterin aldolase [Azomonas macrocytogenes]